MGDGGHYSYLTGKTARFVAHQRSRGMSAGALARLPKVSDLDNAQLPTRSVLARKPTAHGIGIHPWSLKTPGMSETARERLRSAKCHDLPFQIAWGGLPDERVTARAKAIINEVAAALGVEGYQIANRRQGSRFAVARQIAIYMVMQYAKTSIEGAAELFDLKDGKTIRYALGRVALMVEAGDRTFVLAHDAAQAAIVSRWPECAA